MTDWRARLFVPLGLLALAYVLTFGLNITWWLWMHLVDGEPVPTGSTWRGVGKESVVLAYALGLVALAVAYSGRRAALRSWLCGTADPRPGSALVGFGLPMLAQIVGLVPLIFLVRGDVSEPERVAWLGPDLAHGLIQGALAEELILVAAPVVILRYLRPNVFDAARPFLILVCALVAARMYFHLYQGVGAVQHLLWAYVSVTVFVVFGRVWPLIVQHAYYNAFVHLMLAGYDHPALLAGGVLLPWCAVVLGFHRLGVLRGDTRTLRLLAWPAARSLRGQS